MPLDNFKYYVPAIVTENETLLQQIDGPTIGAANSSLGKAIENTLKEVADIVEETGRAASKVLRFFVKIPGVSELATREIEIKLDPNTKEYTVGELVIDVAGGVAAGLVLAPVVAAIAPIIGIGAGIVGLSVITAGVASLAWSAIKEIDGVDTLLGEAQVFIDNLFGTSETEIEVVDGFGNLVGGVNYLDGLLEKEELEAIDDLLNFSILDTFPDISEDYLIRINNVSNDGSFSETRNLYRLYDGKLVDVISNEFEIQREELLFLGNRDEPNRNIDIYFSNPIVEKTLVYANSENRFFVPLPIINSSDSEIIKFHPGNIYYGTDGGDDLSVFENNTSFNSELETDNTLILGLEGDDFLSADVGTNFIFGGTGNDNIAGIAGEDTVYFTDDFANYDYSIDDNGVVTFTHARGTQADGTDTLIDIEQAQFKDRIVSLPLEEPQTEPGSVSELEDGSVTFKFKTTLDESQSSTFIGLPPEIVGTNPEIELTYTFTPTQTRFGFTGLAPVPSTYNRVIGSLRINDQTTVLDYGDIKVSDGKNNDGYNVSFIPKNDASLFGYDIGRIALDISDGSYFDNNGDFIQGGTIFNSISIPTDAQFANKDSLFFDLLITANAPKNEVENSIFVSVNERASSSERTPFTLTSDNSGEETSDEISEESTTEESTTEESPEEPIDKENSESEQPPTDEEEIVEPPVNESDLEDPDSLIDEVPENNSPINNPQETEIQLQLFAPDLESPVTEPLISTVRIPDEYTELSTSGLDTSDFVPVDVNIDIDLGAGSVPGRISFEVDENEGSGSFAPGEFNGYVFTDVFDEIPAIENVTLSETANSLGLESSDITFTENTIEVNVESLAYSPGLNALLDVEFADL